MQIVVLHICGPRPGVLLLLAIEKSIPRTRNGLAELLPKYHGSGFVALKVAVAKYLKSYSSIDELEGGSVSSILSFYILLWNMSL